MLFLILLISFANCFGPFLLLSQNKNIIKIGFSNKNIYYRKNLYSLNYTECDFNEFEYKIKKNNLKIKTYSILKNTKIPNLSQEEISKIEEILKSKGVEKT